MSHYKLEAKLNSEKPLESTKKQKKKSFEAKNVINEKMEHTDSLL